MSRGLGERIGWVDYMGRAGRVGVGRAGRWGESGWVGGKWG